MMINSFSHPPEQPIPTIDRLHTWYKEIIQHANQEGIVTGMTSVIDEYLSGKYGRG